LARIAPIADLAEKFSRKLGFLLAKAQSLVLQSGPVEWHSAHGEIATWDDTVLTIEATHPDYSHRRQVSGNFKGM
jgi:hypothetical protein